MINNEIKNLQKKITKLEDRLNEIENKNKKNLENFNFSIWTKNLLNINVLDKKTITIKQIESKSKNHLFFQLNIQFFNYSNQDIKFGLLCDNVMIGNVSSNYQNGVYEATIYGTYQNSIFDRIKTELFIDPKLNKQVTLIKSILTVWGITQNIEDEFCAVQTEDEYHFSYLSNNQLFYKNIKKENELYEHEFDFITDASAHSICRTNSNLIYLFRVDENGNLFFSQLLNTTEIYIANNVSKVSCCSHKESIYFVYVKNGECYWGEIINNTIISNTKINSLFGEFVNCYIYSNSNDKCYLILSKQNGNNYLLENINNNHCSSENIFADISLTISTTEGSLWYFHFTINLK